MGGISDFKSKLISAEERKTLSTCLNCIKLALQESSMTDEQKLALQVIIDCKKTIDKLGNFFGEKEKFKKITLGKKLKCIKKILSENKDMFDERKKTRKENPFTLYFDSKGNFNEQEEESYDKINVKDIFMIIKSWIEKFEELYDSDNVKELKLRLKKEQIDMGKKRNEYSEKIKNIKIKEKRDELLYEINNEFDYLVRDYCVLVNLSITKYKEAPNTNNYEEAIRSIIPFYNISSFRKFDKNFNEKYEKLMEEELMEDFRELFKFEEERLERFEDVASELKTPEYKTKFQQLTKNIENVDKMIEGYKNNNDLKKVQKFVKETKKRNDEIQKDLIEICEKDKTSKGKSRIKRLKDWSKRFSKKLKIKKNKSKSKK